MGANSNIEWTDHTFNPWIGCTKVSPGCANCYAETLDAKRFSKTMDGGTKTSPVSHWGQGAPRHRTSTWGDPVRWNKEAGRYPDQCTKCAARLCMEAQIGIGNETCPSRRNDKGKFDPTLPKCGGVVARNVRPRVFCASLADWLDDEVPIDWFADLLDLVALTPHLDWLLLSKRPQNWRARLEAIERGIFQCGTRHFAGDWLGGEAPANVWLGTTVEDQVRADERVPVLLSIPARVRFLSCEPMLGPIDLLYSEALYPGGPPRCCSGHECACQGQPTEPPLLSSIDWLICGGESGPGARPMHPDWARSLRDQCAAAGVAFLFKQWGEHIAHPQPNATWPDGTRVPAVLSPVSFERVGKKAAGRLLDGQEHNAFPEVRA